MSITDLMVSEGSLESAKLDLAKDRKRVIREMEEIHLDYSAAIRQVTTKLEILGDDYRQRDEYGPIHHIQSRLKSMDSLLEKAERYGIEDPINNMDEVRDQILDIAGVRVVCNYREDIYALSELLLKQNDIKLLKIKDYNENPKESGCRSFWSINRCRCRSRSNSEASPWIPGQAWSMSSNIRTRASSVRMFRNSSNPAHGFSPMSIRRWKI